MLQPPLGKNNRLEKQQEHVIGTEWRGFSRMNNPENMLRFFSLSRNVTRV